MERALDHVERELYSSCRGGRSRAVAISRRVAHDLEPFLGVELARSAPVVRNGVELERFSHADGTEVRRELARKLGCHEGGLIALFVAHRFALKGLDALIRALPKARGLYVAVAGRDRPSPFERLARRLGVSSRVLFLGERNDMPELYAAVDLVTHPSRYDPCSLVVLEALAAGRPVLASRADGASELVVDGASGFVIDDPDDGDALALRLSRLAADASLRARLAQGARAAARPVEACAREILELARA
jgi:UDP-glucose:(heptosyl)LPS alpha-1,3-glucosyltransferase